MSPTPPTPAESGPHRQPEAVSAGHYQPLLGTDVEIRVVATGDDIARAQTRARAAEEAAVAEMVRLQGVFTVFHSQSALCRWRSGELDSPPTELIDVLAAAERWWSVGDGAFHPAAGALRARWLRAEREQRMPTAAELADLAATLGTLPFTVRDAAVHRLGDCSGVELNAIAKGHIAGRALAAAWACPGVRDVLVNAGGDLCHRGPRVLRVGIADPADPTGQRNLHVLGLADGALATSGPALRGFRIAGQWFGHVLDPRSGWPVARHVSTTILAEDPMTADVLATVVGVLPWEQAVGIVDAQDGAAAYTIAQDATVRCSAHWPAEAGG